MPSGPRGPLRPQLFFHPVETTAGQNPVVITPGTVALVLTEFAPTVATPRLVTPARAPLVLTGFAPIVSTPRLITPAKASFVLATFVPTVTTPRLVTPAKASLALATFAPSIATPRKIAPAKAALILIGFAPTVIAGGSGPIITSPPPQQSAAHNTYIGSSGGFIAPELWRNFLRRTFGIRNFWRYDQALMLLAMGEIDEDEFIAMVSSIREYLAS